MKKNQYILIALVFLFFSCGNEPAVDVEETSSEQIEEKMEEPTTPILQGLPIEYVEKLHSQCNKIEATFYLTSQSMSTGNSIEFLNMFDFSNTPTTLNTSDNGHVLFLAGAEQIVMGRLSLSPTSNYIYFEIDGQKYYNKIQEQSLTFLNSIAVPQ